MCWKKGTSLPPQESHARNSLSLMPNVFGLSTGILLSESFDIRFFGPCYLRRQHGPPLVVSSLSGDWGFNRILPRSATASDSCTVTLPALGGFLHQTLRIENEPLHFEVLINWN